jgi:sporulation protein YlmC with PRC-barrel domain
MAADELDLAYRLLDLDLVDSEGRRCGKVDDLVLEGSPGESTYVAAILSGSGALPRRFPRRLRDIGARVFRGDVTRVRWSSVEKVDAAVKLNATAAQLNLGGGDRAAAKLVERLPGS